MAKWSRNETLSLITEDEARPELWDEKNPLHKDLRKRNQHLQELAKICNRTIDDVKRKIHSHRSAYSRELKKVSKKKSGQATDENYKSTWEFYDALQFTKASITGDATISSLDNNSVDITESPIPPETCTDTGSEYVQSATTAPQNKNNKSVQKMAEDEAYTRAMRILQRPVDAHQIYGDHVASELREMSEVNCKKAKLEISSILLKYAEAESAQLNSSVAAVDVVQPQQHHTLHVLGHPIP